MPLPPPLRAAVIAGLTGMVATLVACGSGGTTAPDGTYRGAFDTLTDDRRGGPGGTPLTIGFRLTGGHVSQLTVQVRVECAGEGSAYPATAGETDLDGSGHFAVTAQADGADAVTVTGVVGADGQASGRVDAPFNGRCGVDSGSWHARPG